MPDELVSWLTLVDHTAIAGWATEPPRTELACAPRLVARLTEVARPLGAARVFVAGCPVIHHPSGVAIAAGAGDAWCAVRSGEAAGGLSVEAVSSLPVPWIEVDPFAPDTAFARGIDLLRRHVSVAFSLAAAGDT